MRKILWILGSITLLGIAGCGHRDDQTPAPDAVVEIDKPDSPSLNLRAQTYLSSAWLQPCDKQYQNQELEITKAIDDHRDAISKMFANAKVEDGGEFVKLGPLTMVRQKNEVPEIKDEWTGWASGWSKAFEDYQKIKNDSNSGGWYFLDQSVKSILSDDRDRLYYVLNLQLDKDSEPLVRRAIEIVTECRENPACTWLYGDNENFNFRKNNYIYDWFDLKIFDKTGEDKKKWIDNYLKRLAFDYVRNYGFILNGSVKRITAKLIELPLDIGDFSGFEDEIGQTIEKIWSSPSLKLKVRWVATPQEGAYKLKASGFTAERQYVSRSSKTVVLASAGNMHAIAHEIGHVLGFADRYFDVWKPSECLYRIQENYGDLMSNSSAGSVTKSEWQELDKRYPYKIEEAHN